MPYLKNTPIPATVVDAQGSGTPDTVAKFIDGDTIGDSRIVDDGVDPVTVTGDNPDESTFRIVLPSGSEATGGIVFEIIGENGRQLLSMDAYGTISLVGAHVDPTNGGSAIDFKDPAGGFRHEIQADNGAGDSLARFNVASNKARIAAVEESTSITLTCDPTTGVITLSAPTIILDGLPTSDPEVVGALWNLAGAVMISAG